MRPRLQRRGYWSMTRPGPGRMTTCFNEATPAKAWIRFASERPIYKHLTEAISSGIVTKHFLGSLNRPEASFFLCKYLDVKELEQCPAI